MIAPRPAARPPSWRERAQSGTRAHAWALSLALAAMACGDRAPPAMWPRPEPPSLAEPLPATRGPSAVGRAEAAPEAAASEPAPAAAVTPTGSSEASAPASETDAEGSGTPSASG